jgi:4-oxalocrotonate tautomerase
MPHINLKLIGKLTRKQKQTIAKEFSETIFKVTGKEKDKTQLVIEEINAENWAKGDKLLG